jgi:hypothetical protein
MGTYLCQVEGQGVFGKAGVNETRCVDFTLAPLQAGVDVDQDALAQALNGAPLRDKKIRHRLFITEDSTPRLKNFLLNDLSLEPTNIRQMASEAWGKQVYVKITHTPSKNGKTIFINVDSTWKV